MAEPLIVIMKRIAPAVFYVNAYLRPPREQSRQMTKMSTRKLQRLPTFQISSEVNNLNIQYLIYAII